VSLSQSCRLFGVSRQSLYQSKRRHEHRRNELNRLKPLVHNIRSVMPKLGTRKLYYLLQEQLQQQQIKIGRDALFAYLKQERMLITPTRKYTKTTDSKHWLKKYPNLYKDLVVDRPEQVYVSDITYIKSKEKVHYLALVTDAYSRKIVGHHLGDDMTAESVVKAVSIALKNRKSQLPLIHHSDRGLQYCSQIYQEKLKQYKVLPSMTDGYDCYQNAMAERVNGILKNEFLFTKCKDFKDLNTLVNDSIYTYNHRRPHLALKMKTPNIVNEKTLEELLQGSNLEC
jgi:putative transposase